MLRRGMRSVERSQELDIRTGSKSWIPGVTLVSPRSDGVRVVRVYLTEGHLAIGVIPKNEVVVWVRTSPRRLYSEVFT